MKPTQALDDILGLLARQHAELDGLVAGLDEAGFALPSGCPGWSISDVLLHLAQTDEMATASAERRFAEAAAAWAGRAAALGSEAGAGGQAGGSAENPGGGDNADAGGGGAATGAGGQSGGSRAGGGGQGGGSRARAGGGGGVTIDDLAGLAVAAERGRAGREVYERWRGASEAQAKALARCSPGDRLPWVAGDLSALTLATTRLAESWIHTGDVALGLGVELRPDERLRPIARLAWRTLPYAFARAGRTLSGPVALRLAAPDGTTWEFIPDEPAATTITGPALDFCQVAARRHSPAATALTGTGPDADAVLDLVRTFA